MPSPFPGMDPWIEKPEYFGDFHHSMTYLLREAINARVPKGYAARGTTLVWMEEEQRREPDVGVFDRSGRDRTFNGPLTMAGAIAVEEEAAPVERKQSYLKIFAKDGMRLVTVVELVSRSNKRPGKGRKAYLKKQAECKENGVHLVEIDLLRGGPHTTVVPLAKLRAKAGAFDYHASIATCGATIRYYAVPIRLAEPLPTIPIPLDPEVEPVRVDLQPLFERTYDTGKYGEFMDFAKPCDPPLTPEQQSWSEGVLKARGLLK